MPECLRPLRPLLGPYSTLLNAVAADMVALGNDTLQLT